MGRDLLDASLGGMPLAERLQVLEDLARGRAGLGLPAAVRQRMLADRIAAAGIKFFQPTPQQVPVLKCEKRGCFVVGGNRCLAKGTMVAGLRMGPVPIESIRPGDWVFGWDPDTRTCPPVRVLAVYANGPKPVNEYAFEAGVTLTATEDHEILCLTKHEFNRLNAGPWLAPLKDAGLYNAYRFWGCPWMSESAPPAPQVGLVSVIPRGEVETYDLLVDHQSHIFLLANGLLSQNSGKTTAGAAETVYRLLGAHPYKKVHTGNIKVWACSQDLPGTTDQPHKQLEELRRWIPHEALRGGNWNTAYAPMARTLHGQNGKGEWIVVFKGYDQGQLKFESDAINFCHLDEEPEDKRIWTSILLRLADYDGAWMITCTPLLSLEGKGWIEELWEARNEPDADYETHVLLSEQNPHVRAEVFEALFSQLSDEEAKVRRAGAFARLGGRVLSEFDPAYHIYDGPLPPPSWRHYLIVDPGGRNATAGLFAAADPSGTLWLYGEHYVRERLPRYHLRCFDAMYQSFGAPHDITTQFDPAARARERTLSHGQMDYSVMDEYYRASDEMKLKWFKPSFASNADVFAYRVKRMLAMGKLFVYRHMRWWLWEADKWTYERQVVGIRAREKPIPERPVDRDDHLMACHSRGTLVSTGHGVCPIENVQAGMMVWTRDGLREVVSAWETGLREVSTIVLSNGMRITSTPSHSYWVTGRGWIPVACLRYRDKLEVWAEWRQSNGAVASGDDIRIRTAEATGPTSAHTFSGGRDLLTFIRRSGKRLTEWMRSQMAATSITRTAIARTTTHAISGAFRLERTSLGTTRGSVLPASESTCFGFALSQRRAGRESVPPRMATGRYGRTGSGPPGPRSRTRSSVLRVVGSTRPSRMEGIASAHPGAGPSGGRSLELTTFRGGATTAGSSSGATDTTRGSGAAVYVVAVLPEPGKRPVYNLQVAGPHEYYANGVLVSNCTRYLCNARPDPLKALEPPKSILEQHWDDIRKMKEDTGGDDLEPPV